MIRAALSTLALLTTIAVSPAAATVPPAGVRVPSAKIDRIRNWYASTDTAVYVRSQARKWYKAELAQPCWGMPEANRIKVNMTDGDRLDNHSTVRVHGEQCRVASVYRVQGPLRPVLMKRI